MKITIETLEDGQEEEVVIRCKQVDDDVLKMIKSLKARKDKLTAYTENEIVFLQPEKIFYFEAVGNKVFACCEKKVYEVRKKLYELEEEYASVDFLRISKSIVLNLAKISYLSPSFNGKFDSKLKNGEIIVISRQYVVALKKKLGI